METGPKDGLSESRATDLEIAGQVKAAISADGRLAPCDIEIVVDGAVVELDGRVNVEFQRNLSEACAYAVAGVRNVVNRLKVDTY